MLEKYPEDVKLVFKHFPLAMHPFARRAAVAAAAAHRQGKFWEYQELLFKNSSQLNEDLLRKLANDLKLDVKAFERDLNDPAILAAVDQDMRDGQMAGVRGTPSVYVNGRLLLNRTPEGFAEMIEQVLKKAR